MSSSPYIPPIAQTNFNSKKSQDLLDFGDSSQAKKNVKNSGTQQLFNPDDIMI